MAEVKLLTYQWAVIGAGPAGILAVGKLLDQNIPPEKIVWIDPEFSVGNLGAKWYNVSSNTRVALFEKFLESSQALNYQGCPYRFDHLDPDATCLLSEVVKPLKWVTQQLSQKIDCVRDAVTYINKNKLGWEIFCHNKIFISRNIILAHGATENIISPKSQINCIDLATALNPDLLLKNIKPEEKVAVYGASHSGVLVIKNLLDLGCSVINFYKQPIKYAIYQSDHIIYDNTGLKGLAAKYAREYMEMDLHPKLTRCDVNSEQAENLARTASKAVYAVGFHANQSIKIEGVNINYYDRHTGILALGLYGFGIAFPEKVTDRYGITELSVGLFKFARYLERVLPIWLQYNHAE